MSAIIALVDSRGIGTFARVLPLGWLYEGAELLYGRSVVSDSGHRDIAAGGEVVVYVKYAQRVMISLNTLQLRNVL